MDEESFLEASFGPITATVLPQGSFMLAKTAIGNKVYFPIISVDTRKVTRHLTTVSLLEYYTVEF